MCSKCPEEVDVLRNKGRAMTMAMNRARWDQSRLLHPIKLEQQICLILSCSKYLHAPGCCLPSICLPLSALYLSAFVCPFRSPLTDQTRR
jgi:hypothetical protein